MPALHLSCTRLRRPAGRLALNWRHPFARYATFAWTGSNPTRDLARGLVGTPAGSWVRAVTVQGPAYQSGALVDTGINFGLASPVSVVGATGSFTVAVLAQPPGSTTSSSALYWQRGGANSESVVIATGRYGYLSADARDWVVYLRDTGGNTRYVDQSNFHGNQPDGALRWYGATLTAGVPAQWRDGVAINTAAGGSAPGNLGSASQQLYIGGGISNYSNPSPTVQVLVFNNYAFNAAAWAELVRWPWMMYLGDPNRVYFDVGASGGTTVTTAASGRLRARGADAVTTTRETASTGRLRARGGTTAQPIKAVAVAGRIKARGSDTTTSIRARSAAGRIKARGSDTATSVRSTLAAGRIKARGTSAATHVAPGIVVASALGRLRARGGCTASSIRLVAISGRIKARGAAAGTSIRTGLATGRLKARGITTAAPVVAGTIVTSCAGRLRARGSSSCTTTRIVAETGRLRARGADQVTSIRALLAAGRLRAKGSVVAGPVVGVIDTSALGRLRVRGYMAYTVQPPLVLVPARVCVSASQPARVAIGASILACSCTN